MDVTSVQLSAACTLVKNDLRSSAPGQPWREEAFRVSAEHVRANWKVKITGLAQTLGQL